MFGGEFGEIGIRFASGWNPFRHDQTAKVDRESIQIRQNPIGRSQPVETSP